MGWLDAWELKQVQAAELSAFASPIPTQSVSSDEFMPAPQTDKQREFEARIKQYGAELARYQGMSRRAFFRTAAGMAAAFVAMNDTYGPFYHVDRAEAATPEKAGERAKALSDQFVMDMHTHFLRDDTRIQTFVRIREAVARPVGIPISSTSLRPWKTSNSIITSRKFSSIATPKWPVSAARRPTFRTTGSSPMR